MACEGVESTHLATKWHDDNIDRKIRVNKFICGHIQLRAIVNNKELTNKDGSERIIGEARKSITDLGQTSHNSRKSVRFWLCNHRAPFLLWLRAQLVHRAHRKSRFSSTFHSCDSADGNLLIFSLASTEENGSAAETENRP